MKTTNLILLSLSSLFLMYCGTPIDITDQYNLDRNGNRIPQVVFESRICNQIDSNYVKITKVLGIGSSKEQYISTATVSISDNRGNSEMLTYVGRGRYQCTSLLGINDGRVYTLKAEVEGKMYQANAVIPATPMPIDVVKYLPDEENEGKYKVLIFANVHTDFDEYYMFQRFANDTLTNKPNELLVADNSQLNGKINGIVLADNIKKGVKFRYKFFSISKDTYKFYLGIIDQVGNDGGITTSPPANAQGNIPDANGVFQACYFTTDTLTIK